MCSKMNCFFVLALLFFEFVAPIPYPDRYYNNNYENSNPSEENGPRFYQNRNFQRFQRSDTETSSQYREINQEPQIKRKPLETYVPRSLPAYMSPVPTQSDSRLSNDNLEEVALPRQVYTPVVEPSVNFPSVGNERQIAHQAKKQRRPLPTNIRESYTEVNENENTNVYQASSRLTSNRGFANPSSTVNRQEIRSELLNQNRPIFNDYPESILQSDASTTNQILNQNRLILNKLSELSDNVNERKITNTFTQPIRVNKRQEISPDFLSSSFREPVTFEDYPNLETAQEPFYVPAPARETYRPEVNVRREQPQVSLLEAERAKSFIPVERDREQIEPQEINRGQQPYRPVVNEQPRPVPQKYDVNQVIASQRIRNVLSETKHKKRYLVIHPDGRVDHIDDLEHVAKSHPNYVLVNAGQIVTNDSKTGTKVENVTKIQTSIPATQKSVAIPETLPVTSKPYEQNKIAKVEIPSTTIAPQSPISTETIIIDPEPQVSTPVSPAILEVEEVVEPKPVLSIQEVLEEQEVAATSPPATEAPGATTTIIAVTTTTTTVATPTITAPTTVAATVTTPTVATPIDATATVPTPIIESVSVTTVQPAVEVTSPVVTEAPAALIEPNEPNNVSEIELITIEPEDLSAQESNSTLTQNIVSQTKEEEAEVPQKYKIETISTEEINNGKDLDITAENPLGKPSLWFNTTDPGFWDKLSDGKENNVIYFFQVKSQPRVEKDTQRTVFPDGTVIEELTETVWYHEGEPPVVTKTTRVLHPEDILAKES